MNFFSVNELSDDGFFGRRFYASNNAVACRKNKCKNSAFGKTLCTTQIVQDLLCSYAQFYVFMLTSMMFEQKKIALNRHFRFFFLLLSLTLSYFVLCMTKTSNKEIFMCNFFAETALLYFNSPIC